MGNINFEIEKFPDEIANKALEYLPDEMIRIITICYS